MCLWLSHFKLCTLNIDPVYTQTISDYTCVRVCISISVKTWAPCTLTPSSQHCQPSTRLSCQPITSTKSLQRHMATPHSTQLKFVQQILCNKLLTFTLTSDWYCFHNFQLQSSQPCVTKQRRCSLRPECDLSTAPHCLDWYILPYPQAVRNLVHNGLHSAVNFCLQSESILLSRASPEILALCTSKCHPRVPNDLHCKV